MIEAAELGRFITASKAYLTSPPPLFSEKLRRYGSQDSIWVGEENASGFITPIAKQAESVLDLARDAKKEGYQLPDRHLTELTTVVIPFSDDLPFSFEEEYFPSQSVIDTIDKLVKFTGFLDTKNQLSLVSTDGKNLWEGMYTLSLALRVLSRDHDRSMGVETEMDKSVSVLSRLPVFGKKSGNVAEVGGDWYHFWSCVCLGSIYEKNKSIYKKGRLIFDTYGLVFTNTGRLAKTLRGSKNRCGYHEDADLLGFNTGITIAKILDY